jgi:hypothetical protein
VSAQPSATTVRRDLDELTRQVLDFERSWRGRGMSKDRAIRTRLGLTPTRYRQLLVRATDLPEALAYAPMLVARLRRLREARRGRRASRRLGHPDTPG